MEKVYIGTKVIAAEPMDEITFICNFTDGKKDVPRETRAGYKVRYEDRYISWSPKETFERAYRLMSDGELLMIFDRISVEAVSYAPKKSPSDLPEDLKPKD